MFIYVFGSFSTGIRFVRDFLVHIGERDQYLINEMCWLHFVDHVLFEFIEESSLRLSFAILHSNMTKEFTKTVATQCLFNGLPFTRVYVALWDRCSSKYRIL